MSTKPYDQAFKYLAEQDAQGLLVLLGHLRPDEPARVELLPRELSVAALLPDQPYLVERPEGASIAHIEAQTAYERNIPAREVEYEVRLWLTYRLPVFSYVLLVESHDIVDSYLP